MAVAREMLMSGQDINRVMKTALEVAPKDWEMQVTILALATIWVVRQGDVPKENFIKQMSALWEIHMKPGPPLDEQTDLKSGMN